MYTLIIIIALAKIDEKETQEMDAQAVLRLKRIATEIRKGVITAVASA